MPTIRQLHIMWEVRSEFGLDENDRPLAPPSKNHPQGEVIGQLVYDHTNKGLKVIIDPNLSETEKSDL